MEEILLYIFLIIFVPLIVLGIVMRIMIFCYKFNFYKNASKYYEYLNDSVNNNK